MYRILLIFCCCMLSAVASYADGVLKVQSEASSYLLPETVEVRTEVSDQVAVTVTRQTFRNTTGKAVRLQYGFPTDANATVTLFRWWQHGVLRKAEMTGKPQDSVVGGPGGAPDLAYMNHLGATPFVFTFRDSLAADSVLTVELTYMELLRYAQGRVVYTYPLRRFRNEQFSFRWSFALSSGRVINHIEADTHPVELKATDYTAEGTYAQDAEPADHNLVVRYQLSREDLGAVMLSHKPLVDDGYFILLAEPDPNTSQDKVIQKIFTFIIDVSGSMLGTKMEQAKAAARYCIDNLNDKDQFNIIAFSSKSKKFHPQPVAATYDNIEDGREFIRNLAPGGGTNMQEALLQGLVQEMPDTTSNIIVFLTDGQATLDQQAIVNANTKSVRIFVFGIGEDVNKDILQQLAVSNNGLSEFLGTDNVDSRIGGFYNKIRNPLLLSPSVEFTAGQVHETYPLQLPDIYVGEQLLLLGRYKQPGPAQAILRGKTATDSALYAYDVEFTGDSLVNLFLPKMWAKYKIDALLILMSGVQTGSNQWREWRDEIIRLSLLYGIVTPFSSFSDPGQDPGDNTTFVYEYEHGVPDVVLQCSPNPFTNRVQITLAESIPMRGDIVLVISDLSGRVVRTIRLPHTVRTIEWDGTDEVGALVPNGVYLLTVTSGDVRSVQRVVLAR